MQSIYNSTDFEISNNSIQGYSNSGIWINSSGTSLSEGYKSIIYNNVIYDCGSGISLYNTKADIKGNEIYENEVGVQLYNNTYCTFNNNLGKHQIIRDNKYYELYASHCSFPSIFKWNQVFDDCSSSYPLIFWDAQLYGPGCKDINNNFFGYGFVPQNDLYPEPAFIWSPLWDPFISIEPLELNIAEILYQTGLDYFANEDYTSAEVTFKQLIDNHPESPFAKAGLHELFALRKVTDYNFESLHSYLSTFTPADSSLFTTADYLATRSKIMVRDWQPAVDWYENRIVNPPSYQDSVFAVIDLGEIHLMMEADTLNNNGGPNLVKGNRPQIIARLKEVIPESKVAYEINRANLLATLPKIDKTKTQRQPLTESGNKKGILKQSIPNPASESTTVTYEVYSEGSVEIKVYNLLGQPVLDLPQGAKQKGIYNVVISLEGLTTGLYKYVMFVDGLKVDGKKFILCK